MMEEGFTYYRLIIQEYERAYPDQERTQRIELTHIGISSLEDFFGGDSW